jgi:carbonic anhydrase
MPNFAAGVVRFQNDVYPEKKSLFEKLSHGQTPEALFIACSDSRVETAMITQTDPGELFICRNAGNIIPPHTTHTGGTTASIEFAVSALKVPHIVVCGHTECSAMQGALDVERIADLPHIKVWLGYARAAVQIVNELAADKSEAEKMKMLLEQNVILQLRHLKTHPCVATGLAKGDLELHGWIYDIKTGHVHAYDETTDSFIDVNEYYASEIANINSSGERSD